MTTVQWTDYFTVVWNVQLDNGPLDHLCYVNLDYPIFFYGIDKEPIPGQEGWCLWCRIHWWCSTTWSCWKKALPSRRRLDSIKKGRMLKVLGRADFLPELRGCAASPEWSFSLSQAGEDGASCVGWNDAVGQLGAVGIKPYHQGVGRIE